MLIATPTAATATVVASVMTDEGAVAPMRRVAKSRKARITAESSASSDQALKPAAPGRTMISTPTKPARMASQRRQPTRSMPTTTAKSVRMMGAACRMAVILAIGRWASAVM